jgi:vacuolar-type H+-ATPase subunit E/Vma4
MTGLEAVRSHHLAAAREHADAILRDARAQAQQIRDKSAADAAAMMARAEQEGADAAELDTVREWTGARRRARTLILAAQSDAYSSLRAAITTAVRADPRYAVLLQRLVDVARRRLGPGAEIVIDTDGDRGVTATRMNRHIDWTLGKIVEQSLERLGPRIEELWL